MEKLKLLEQNLINQINTCLNLSQLEEQKRIIFGANSELNQLFLEIRNINSSEKKTYGQACNALKILLDSTFDKKYDSLLKEIIDQQKELFTDYSAVPLSQTAKINALTQARWEIEDILQNMGFDIVYPYEIDTLDNNFTYVNIAQGHPARDMWDTFFTDSDSNVLITHTSSMQNRVIKSRADRTEGFAVGVPGKCFRNESTDARHEHTFYQIEGIVVGKNINISNMIWTIGELYSQFFKTKVDVRVNPDFFPFVEPGNGVEIRWNGQSEHIKKITKGTGWLEIMGAGMIHPKVLEMGGVNPDIFSGFAFGGGIERAVMVKHNIEDVRLFHANNKLFNNQF